MVKDCRNKVKTATYCNKHYLRYKRHGDPEYRTKVAKGEWEGVMCSASGCDRSVRCKGLCAKHYLRDHRLRHMGLPR